MSARIPTFETPYDRLVEAATALFYEHGFRAVAVNDIVARSGVTKSTLYRYFESKDDLAAACLSKLALDDLEELVAIAKRLSAAPMAQFGAIVAAAAAKMGHPAYRGWLLSNLEVEIHDDHHVISRVCKLYRTRLRSHLREAAEQAGVATPDLLVGGLLLLLEGAGVSFRSLGHEEAAASMIRGWEILLREHGVHHPVEQETPSMRVARPKPPPCAGWRSAAP
ncbi:TetR/AcrR family transcriptional regulator [Caulobacter segnis]|uniref:TetR/AcrR family transcriptional regulator n=1 Tax=Caulobacter segnis TaxID=88688 RepID=UPI001CBC361F|nr:TetR/AcrR family transcriptional regulator [Caulobacter segnis]